FPAQSRPGLSVSLAVERRFGQNVADLPKEVGVGVGRSGAPLHGRGEGQFELRPDPVQRRSSHLELLGHSGHAIASVGGRRDGAAQSLDFRQGKGDSASSARALSLASSSLIVRSPTRALSLSTSSSAAVLSRDFRPAWPAARNSSRHRESVAAVTPSSRESSSRASPRRRRRTASALRLEENRPRSFPDFCFPIGTPFRGHHAAVGCPRKSWCGGKHILPTIQGGCHIPWTRGVHYWHCLGAYPDPLPRRR